VSLLSVAQAQAAIYANCARLPTTSAGLRELTGSVLAETIFMERDQPPFERVSMDGIAMHSSATTRKLRIVGTQAAGTQPLSISATDQCIEIMTGAELPHGCDCVIPVEHLQINAGSAQLMKTIVPSAWLNVHRRGSDARQGQAVLHPGTRLGATDIAALASAGHAQATVCRSPRIALASTGDELIEPGAPIASWQVRRSNTYALQAALQQQGHAQIVDRHLADDLPTLRTALDELLQHNEVLVLSGGVSMGQFDFVPQALTELGVRCVFHKIAQRPGKPMWFGVRSDAKTVYALPGNPVSTLACLHRYVLPGIVHSMGMTPKPVEQVSLQQPVKASADLTVFMPIRLHSDTQAQLQAEPRPTRGSGDFISLLGTDGFVELPPTQGMIAAGTVVPLYRW
jgi:molybdopterin molybdotransferase